MTYPLAPPDHEFWEGKRKAAQLKPILEKAKLAEHKEKWFAGKSAGGESAASAKQKSKLTELQQQILKIEKQTGD